MAGVMGRIFRVVLVMAAVWQACGGQGLAASAQVVGEEQGFEVQKLEIRTGTGMLTYQVEMAVTQAQREQGLMNRPSLGGRRGMLFDFGVTREVAMWMKNTLIPLDMLFITADGRIARIEANAAPQSLTIRPSGLPVRAVLELAGGEVARAGIRVGDLLVHPMFPQNGIGQGKGKTGG